MERTKQLVKEGGYAAIVISNTFLTNPGIHQKTRELILENFKIKGIVELGSGAFMATGTNTVVLFMEKRKQGDIDRIKNIIAKFKKNPENINFNNKTKIISQFLKDNYNELEFEDYVSMFTGNLTDKFKRSDLYEEYLDDIITNIESSIDKKKDEKEKLKLQQYINDIQQGIVPVDVTKLIQIELNKIYNYLLNDDINTIVISAGNTKDEIAAFLGYKFSKRKGDEGLKELSDKIIKELDTYTNRNTINSMLYNPETLLDKTKINYYIYKNFLNKLTDEDIAYANKSVIKNNLSYIKINDLFEYDTIDFNSVLNMNSKKKINFKTNYPLYKLKNITKFIPGVTYNKADEAKSKTQNIILTADNITFDNEFTLQKEIYLNKNINIPKEKQLHKGDICIVMSSGSINHVGKHFYVLDDMPYYCGGFLNILRPTNNILPYYLHCILCSSTIKNNISIIANGNNINNLSSKLKYLRVPVPQDISIQQKIIDEFKKLELDKEKSLSSINEFKQSILLDLEKNKTPNNQKLNKYMQLEYGKALPEREREQGNFPVVGSSGIVGYHNDYMIMGPNIIVGRKGSVGKVYYIEENCTPIDTTFYIKINKDKIRLKYAYYILESLNLGNLNSGLGPGGVNRKTIYNKLISVPDLDIQDQFIKKIEVYEKQIEELQKEIDGIPAKKQAILDKYLK